jgi:TatD DNase family protein
MRLVDSHGHLQADRFDDDVDAVVARARAAAVERILVPGWDLASSRAALALADRHPWLDAAVGIHPHDAAKAGAGDWSTITALARDPRILAIGETGLDYDRLFSPREAQLANLQRHLELGLTLGKPVILHCRSAPGNTEAHEALVGMLEAVGVAAAAAALDRGRVPALIHSFSGTGAFASRVLELGLAISISGLAFRRGEEATLGDVVPITPVERLLVETDSPFLSPPGAPRRRNEPEWVRVTATAVAARRGVPPDEAGDQLVAAYDAIFARPS